jgi:hypothetical protein
MSIAKRNFSFQFLIGDLGIFFEYDILSDNSHRNCNFYLTYSSSVYDLSVDPCL